MFHFLSQGIDSCPGEGHFLEVWRSVEWERSKFLKIEMLVDNAFDLMFRQASLLFQVKTHSAVLAAVQLQAHFSMAARGVFQGETKIRKAMPNSSLSVHQIMNYLGKVSITCELFCAVDCHPGDHNCDRGDHNCDRGHQDDWEGDWDEEGGDSARESRGEGEFSLLVPTEGKMSSTYFSTSKCVLIITPFE